MDHQRDADEAEHCAGTACDDLEYLGHLRRDANIQKELLGYEQPEEVSEEQSDNADVEESRAPVDLFLTAQKLRALAFHRVGVREEADEASHQPNRDDHIGKYLINNEIEKVCKIRIHSHHFCFLGLAATS